MAGCPLVLFFGEDSNDTLALVHLARALLPAKTIIETKSVRRPPMLRRDANPKKRRGMAAEVAGFAEVFTKRRPKVIIVAHRDCDDLEHVHEGNAQALESDLSQAGVKYPVAVTPAWELETWWMLFPEELAQARPCWRKVNYKNRSVGEIKNSKEQLRRDLRPARKVVSCPDYSESDSIKIAQLIEQNRSADNTNKLRSPALMRFRNKLHEFIID